MRRMLQSYEMKLSFRICSMSNAGGKEERWRAIALIIRRARQRAESTATLPINELWDLSGTTTRGRSAKREGSATEGHTRWRTPFTVANSPPDVEIDRRPGSVACGCRAFDRFTQDRSLMPTHVLNVPACRWTCTYDGPWNPVRHGICGVISSCSLFSKSSSLRSSFMAENEIFRENLRRFTWYCLYILGLS